MVVIVVVVVVDVNWERGRCFVFVVIIAIDRVGVLLKVLIVVIAAWEFGSSGRVEGVRRYFVVGPVEAAVVGSVGGTDRGAGVVFRVAVVGVEIVGVGVAGGGNVAVCPTSGFAVAVGIPHFVRRCCFCVVAFAVDILGLCVDSLPLLSLLIYPGFMCRCCFWTLLSLVMLPPLLLLLFLLLSAAVSATAVCVGSGDNGITTSGHTVCTGVPRTLTLKKENQTCPSTVTRWARFS